MNRSRWVQLVCGILLSSISVQAEAQRKCIGAPNEQSITFTSDGATDGSLAIRRSIDGETKEEMLDDTGYLGAYYLLHSLVQADESKEIDATKKEDSIRLFRMRLKKLESVIMSVAASDSKFDPAEIFKAIDRIQTFLKNNKSIGKSSLVALWGDLDKALDKGNVQVMAQARQPGTSKWGENEPLKNFTLPTLEIIRGLSCQPSVKSVQLGDALDAFSKVSTESNSGGRQNDLNSFMQEKQKKATR